MKWEKSQRRVGSGFLSFHLLVDGFSVGFDFGDGAAVGVAGDGVDGDLFAADEVFEVLLGLLVAGLALFGCVDAGEADGVLAATGFEGVAVDDFGDGFFYGGGVVELWRGGSGGRQV